jgi:lipoyl synthase
MTASTTIDPINTPVGSRRPKPEWLKVKLPSGQNYLRLKGISRRLGLATVCEEAKCPNIGECWGGSKDHVATATFMLMGDTCTRGCRFCAVKTGNPNGWLDADEPTKLADTIAEAAWGYVVLTSVDRDDLPDGGANHFALCVETIKSRNPTTLIEVLIPDFGGQIDPLIRLLEAKPDVVAQNIETVERLTHPIRDKRAGYQQTLTLLQRIKPLALKTTGMQPLTKSSVMLGLGETDEEIHQTLKHLKNHGVDIITLGQYLQPTSKHWPVDRFVTPSEFKRWQHVAENEYGFLLCASGPLVRSSYRAGELLLQSLLRQNPDNNRSIV